MRTLEDKVECEHISPKRLSNEKKSEHLNNAIRRYLKQLESERNIQSYDSTRIRNFKGRKGEHVADFIVGDIAVIEAKNWDCPGKYYISNYNVKTEITDRFTDYPRHLKRILIIADPVWCDGVRENLLKEGVHIIEIGFLVTDTNQLDASRIIRARMNRILFPKKLQTNILEF